MSHIINDTNMRSIAELHRAIRPSLTLRDYLALERTMVANTRTFLSYVRTAVGLLVAGIGMLKIGELPAFCAPLGLFMIAGSPVPLVVGTIHYFSVRVKWQRFLGEFIDHNTVDAASPAQRAGEDSAH